MASALANKCTMLLLLLLTLLESSSSFTPMKRYSLKVEVSPQQNCTCVPYFQCSDDTGELIVDGSGLLDSRIFSGPCTGYFDVCCNVTKDPLETTTERPERPRGCGYQNPESSPWSGTLLLEGAPQQHRCGFSLIHPQVGMTAAHCVEEKGVYSIHIGNFTGTVDEIAIHPRFSPSTLHNDVALFFLPRPVSRQPSLVCIPPPRSITAPDAPCVAASGAGTLLLPVVSRRACVASLRGTRLGPFFQLHKSFLCAGGAPGGDTCGGDGGGALVCPVPGQPGRYHQAGIVSWGIGCGEGNPGVYVNVGMFREWVDGEVGKRGLDVTTYRY